MASPHKSRKKPSSQHAVGSPSQHASSAATISRGRDGSGPAWPLAALLWPARRGTSTWTTLPLILLSVGLFRWAVGLWGYSGQSHPPMHGDFEAQRHWMELTYHLKPSQWYFYDLEYWGLDYPPLTAYHSWVLGKIGDILNPSWFALDASRGMEDPELKVFMRATVLVSEYLVYIPAAIICNRRLARSAGFTTWESLVLLTALLMQPATMLIDHGHFQYNTIMLGLMLATISSLCASRWLWSCVFFVGALAFKQMALYYAPVVFAYLLGSCLQPRIRILRFVLIALVTVATFAVLAAPLLLSAVYDHYQDPALTLRLTPPPLYDLIYHLVPARPVRGSLLDCALLQATQLVHRIFPLARGVFEDKVANLWCALHTVHKLHRYPIPLLSKAAVLATLSALFPVCMAIIRNPRPALLLHALAAGAWAFFLCSFQVHEKSVLLPLLPTTLLLAAPAPSWSMSPSSRRAWTGFANLLGAWTLYPLLKRDGLSVPYAVLCMLWAWLLGLPPVDWSLYLPSLGANDPARQRAEHGDMTLAVRVIHVVFYITMLVWHGVEAVKAPPSGKPDLWVVLNCLVGAAGFSLCYLWSTWAVLEGSGFIRDMSRLFGGPSTLKVGPKTPRSTPEVEPKTQPISPRPSPRRPRHKH